jgi:predicted amidohydrolase
MEQAVSSGSDLLVFPEMCLSGYGIEEANGDPARKAFLSEETRHAVARIRKESRRLGLDILVSYPLFSRGKTFISAEYVSSGKKIALHRKINLCNYAHYREHLNFNQGNSPTLAWSARGVFGILVCEDVWHALNAVVETLLGAEILLVPSAPCVKEASAGPASLSQWQTITRGTAFLQTAYLVMAARVGEENGNIFLGGSHVVSPEGEIISQLPLFEEALVQVRLNARALEETRKKRPLLRNERVSLYGRVFRKLGAAAEKGGKGEK